MKKIVTLFAAICCAVMMFGQSYGILVNGNTYFAGEPAGQFEGFTQYLAHVQVNAGDYCQIYDATYEASWVVTLNTSSVSGFTLNNDRYDVTVSGCYDFYIKIKYQQDELYIGNGSDCGSGTPIGGETQDTVPEVVTVSSVPSQATDVMLQAFYWDSYTDHGYGDTRWNTLLSQSEEISSYFDLVWLPPASFSTGGTGYIPRQYSNLSSDWGTANELYQLLDALHDGNSRVVADIVINHCGNYSSSCNYYPLDFTPYGTFQPDNTWITTDDEGGVVAVSDFNLDVADKEFVILVGPSGCGKSTTLRMLAGLEDISEGEIYIDDRCVNDVLPKDRDIAMVFQNYALYPHMSVRDNMAFALKLRKMPKDEINRRVQEAAKILEIEHLLDRKPKALSGGQRQRVALGRAIVRDPKVFLMDEPLSNLDAKLRVQMRVEITKLHHRLKTTFVYVTHDQTEAMTMGTRIVVMKDGFIQQVDSPTELYDNPVNTFVAGFIGMPPMNFINAVINVEGSDVFVSFENVTIKLPERYAVEEVMERDGQEVIFGVRPEAITDDITYVTDHPESAFTADVDVVEMLGAETYLYVTVNGSLPLTCRVDPTTSQSAVGQVVDLAVDSNRIHLFDKDTEQSIIS